MKVFIATYHYPPEISGGAARAILLEKILADNGHQTFILSPHDRSEGERGAMMIPAVPAHKAKRSKTPPQPQKMSGHSKFFLTVSKIADALLVPDRLAFWGRNAGIVAARRLASVKPDIVITTSPPESMHLIGLRLAKKQNALWIADLRDGWTLEPLRKSATWPIRSSVERWMERKVFTTADFVSFTSLTTAEDARRRYPELSDKIIYFPTGYDDTLYTGKPANNEKFTIIHTGRFGLSHGARTPAPFLTAVGKFINEQKITDIKLVFYGDYHEEELDLFEPLITSGLLEVNRQVPQQEMVEKIGSADVALLITAKGHLSAAPRKLFDYLGAKLPILALADPGETSRLVSVANAGINVAPDDVTAIKETIADLYGVWKNGELDKRFTYSGAEQFSAENCARRFFSDIGAPL